MLTSPLKFQLYRVNLTLGNGRKESLFAPHRYLTALGKLPRRGERDGRHFFGPFVHCVRRPPSSFLQFLPPFLIYVLRSFAVTPAIRHVPRCSFSFVLGSVNRKSICGTLFLFA